LQIEKEGAKYMTIYEFAVLDINAKADALWHSGIFLDNYIDNKKGVNLYSFNGYFVEVTLNNPNQEIINITPFKRGFRLDKYLDKIILNKLL